MALASQTPRTLSSIRQLNTTLLLDIDRRFGPRQLALALVLFLLLLALSPTIIFGLALLAGLALAARGFPARASWSPLAAQDFFGFGRFAVVSGAVGSGGGIAGVFCLFLFALLFLLFEQAVFDVLFGFMAEDGSLAVVALYYVGCICQGTSGWKGRGEGGRNAVYTGLWVLGIA